MRRSLLLVVALPRLFAPSAFAGDKPAERESVCRVPDIDLTYDTETFKALVSLPASGCTTREHRQFVLSGSISRLDNQWGRDVVKRSAVCGPFRSAEDFESPDEAPRYSCNLAVFLDHPQVKTAQYDVDISYPGASGERTMRVFTFCTSDGETASCEE